MAVSAGNGIPDPKSWEAPSDFGRSGRHHCEDIAEQCKEEGYPSHGSNYDLRVSDLQKEYRKKYPDWF